MSFDGDSPRLIFRLLLCLILIQEGKNIKNYTQVNRQNISLKQLDLAFFLK